MIRIMRAALAAIAIGCSAATAQISTKTGAYESAGTGQYGVSIASVTPLAVPKNGALLAHICVEGANARYTDDGTTPTATTGIPVVIVNSVLCFDYPGPLSAFRIIGTGATMDVSFYK